MFKSPRERETDVHVPPLRVFVSSTWLDLQPERKAVEAALQLMRADTGFAGMEYFGSRNEDTQRASLDEVDHSDIYIGIFAARYGSGITEDEYRRARARDLPCFIYFKAESTITLDKVERDAEQMVKLDKLKAELRQSHTAAEFNSPDDLAKKVIGDLHRWIFDEHRPQVTAPQTPSPPIATPHQLRAPVSDFVGREPEIDVLINALRTGGSAGISGISGMGGIGKTELALLVADRMRPEYTDAQLFIDMRGISEKPLTAADALAECIRAIVGADTKLPEGLDELVKIYRNSLDGKRALILLDNAANSAQVRPLMPPPGCALLVTSRETLALPGMKRIALEQLLPQEARDLLTGIASRTPPDIADQICHLCGYLPLAIRAAGSLLDVTPDLAPAAYVTQLHDERERLKLIGREGVDLDVEASFELSYARLPTETARVFRQLAVFPASFDATAEEKICQDTGHAHLSDLLRRNLVLYNSETARYRLHDLARLFADSRLSEDERDAAQERHAKHYFAVLGKADDLYLEGGEAFMRGLALFDSEWTNIQTGQSWAEGHAGDNNAAAQLCSDYPDAGVWVLHLRRYPRELIGWLKKALSSVQKLNNRVSEQNILVNLGTDYVRIGEHRHAINFFEQGLAIARDIKDRRVEGISLGNIGVAYVELDEQRLAIEYFEQYLAIAQEVGDKRTEGIALANLGVAYNNLGEIRRAIKFYEQALLIAREMDDLLNESNYLWRKSLALDNLGNREQTIACAEAALRIREHIGDQIADEWRAKLAEWREQE
ncbi:MAG TPA: tetratricopeptide repeat protein [Pyrinomonadaceae bacterium]|nr:tetratricopeptide repeat protein [Pyrinomonadaceae bacterium]